MAVFLFPFISNMTTWFLLCYDPFISFGVYHLHHVCIRIELIIFYHREYLGRASWNQDHTCLVHGNGLLPVPAAHIPENQLGQLIPELPEFWLCIFKVGEWGITCAPVKFHIRYNVQPWRNILLIKPVLNGSPYPKLINSDLSLAISLDISWLWSWRIIVII